jgi:hypothetical protein
MTFSNSLPVIDKKLIGRKFCGNFGSLPGFGNVITFASFQGFRKWDIRGQKQKQKLTAGNQTARSLLASGPAGTHGHIFVPCQTFVFFPFVDPHY